MRDPDAGRGLGDAVEVDQIAPRLIAIGAADDQRLIDRMAAILRQELAQRCLAQTGHEDRLVMGQQPHVDERALKIQQHQHVDRLSGKAGQGRQRAGFKHIARIAAARIRQPPDALVVQRLAQRIGRRDHVAKRRARQRFGVQGGGPEQDQQHQPAHGGRLAPPRRS